MARLRRRKTSSITRLPEEQRAYIERAIRAGSMTLDELIADLRRRWPGEPAAEVSRSALHRHEQGIREDMHELMEIETAAKAVFGGTGDQFGEAAADYLTQAATVFAIKAVQQARTGGELKTEDAARFAAIAVKVNDARRMGVSRRAKIAAEAREMALREQREKIEALGASGALDPAAVAAVIKAAYDL
jgi:hypothetical protein